MHASIKDKAALFLLGALVSLTSATPPPADAELWTIQAARRVCDKYDTTCTWSFTISTNVASFAPVPCTVDIHYDSVNAIPASHNNVEKVPCGPYRVSAGWTGSFGEDNGFTTLAVVDEANKRVVFFAYADNQVAGGVAVVPDLQLAPRPW